MRHAAQRIDFPLEFFLPQAHRREDDAHQHHGQDLPAKRHRLVMRYAAAAPKYRLRMLRAPPLDRENHDGHVEEREDREYGRERGALRGLFNRAAQHEVAGVQQPADQRRSQAGVPRPPYAPRHAAPDGTGDQVPRHERQAHLSHTDCQRVVLELLGDQKQDAGHERHRRAGQGRNRHRHVEEDDLENHSLIDLLRKAGEKVNVARQQDQGHRADDVQNFIAQSLSSYQYRLDKDHRNRGVHDVEADQHLQPRAVGLRDGGPRHQRAGQLHRPQQRRYQNRKIQNRQHHFPQPDVDRQGAENRARHGHSPGAQRHHHHQLPELGSPTDIVKDPEQGERDQLHRHHQNVVGQRLAQEQRRAGDGGRDERVQAVVLQFAREAAVQQQRSGEGEDNPQQAAGDLARRLLARVEGETEQQQHDQGEGERSVDGFLGAQLGAQILGHDHQHLPDEGHHPSPYRAYTHPGSETISAVRRPWNATWPRSV